MIIAIRDIENNLEDGVSFTGLFAALVAIGKSQKTLVTQLNGFSPVSLENIYIGKDMQMNMIRDRNANTYDKSGLDGILVDALTAQIDKGIFEQCVLSLVTTGSASELSGQSMLDVLKQTSQTRILDTTETEAVTSFIEATKEEYTNLILYLPYDDKELYDLVTPYTDKEILLIPQGRQIKYAAENAKTDLVIKDFEKESKFDITNMKKQLNVKKLYTLPHNVGYKDAVLDKTLLDFVLTNRKAIKADENFELSSSVWGLLTKYITNTNDDEDDEDMFITKRNKDYLTVQEKSAIPEAAIQEVTVKKGLFRKEKKIMVNM